MGSDNDNKNRDTSEEYKRWLALQLCIYASKGRPDDFSYAERAAEFVRLYDQVRKKLQEQGAFARNPNTTFAVSNAVSKHEPPKNPLLLTAGGGNPRVF